MVLAIAGVAPQFGQYRLQERIGQGHAGTVYRTLDEKTQQDVAIKVLHQHVIDDAAFVDHLHDAARKCEHLTHPNLASLLDLQESGHQLALITELLQGCTLQHYLTHRGVPEWAEIRYIANGILDGLQALHVQGMEYCNIKTSNVFLCDDGIVRLTDFALGRAPQPLERDAQSPDGNDPVTAHYTVAEAMVIQDDLYAFGIILYRMATGHWPFAGEHDADDIFNVSGSWMHHSSKEIPAPLTVNPAMPDCLAGTISALLQSDPKDRPTDILAIREMLTPLGEPALPQAPEDDEGEARFSNISLLQGVEQGKELRHDAEEAELDAAGVPKHSLLWVFKIASENATGGVPLDLCSPPPLEAHVLERLRRAVEVVPPLPDAWHQVQAVFDDPSSSAHDLARVVEYDPVLVAEVLRLANSAAYLSRSGRAITDVSQAITRIGMGPARNLLLQNTTPALGGDGIASKPDMLRIWFHSQAIAGFTRILATHAKSVDQHTVSLYGLLHDIGKLIMLYIEDGSTLQKVRESIASGDSALKAEWDVLGYTHIDAGMMLALHWHLPPMVHRALYFHHHPCWHGPETWPIDVRDQIIIVHMAHLVLQSMMDGDEIGGVWAAEQRTHVEGTEALLRSPIHLPLAEVRLYSEMQQELAKLKQTFPTLYPPIEEEQASEEEAD